MFVEGSIIDKSLIGSVIAKSGFENEKEIVSRFNSEELDELTKEWLIIMGLDIVSIGIQVKLVSNKKGFNQIDKRWLSSYGNMWSIPKDIYQLLQYFTGELKPYMDNSKSNKRMFLDELNDFEIEKFLNCFKVNKEIIINDIFKGRGDNKPKWYLIIKKIGKEYNWGIFDIDDVINHYSNGEVVISPRGSLKIAKVTMQRKGGDRGRKTANILQFKIDPLDLFRNSNVDGVIIE